MEKAKHSYEQIVNFCFFNRRTPVMSAIMYSAAYGLVAQLGERCVRNAEAEGSIPFKSTLYHIKYRLEQAVFFVTRLISL